MHLLLLLVAVISACVQAGYIGCRPPSTTSKPSSCQSCNSGETSGEQLRKGPYEVRLRRVLECDKRGSPGIVFGKNLVRNGTDRVYTDNPFNLPFEIGSAVSSRVTAWRQTSRGTWAQFFRLDLLSACTDALQLSDFSREFTRRALRSMGRPDTCPLPRGNYTVRNLTLQGLPQLTFSEMIYGDYRVDLAYFRSDNRQRLGCIRTLFRVVEKR